MMASIQSLFSTILKRTGQIFLFLFVITCVIGIFSGFIFSKPSGPKMTPDDFLKSQAEIYLSPNTNPAFTSPQGPEIHKAYLSMMCKLSGFGCYNDVRYIEPEAFAGSVFGKLAMVGAFTMTNPPASGSYEVMTAMSHAGVVPKAEAATGIGAAGLYPFSNVWKQMRNIAYLLIVLLVISSGFIVMFRANINPQAVITIESIIPRLIIAIIIIEFSFAISGFMIDLMYVASGLMVVALGSVAFPNITPNGMNDLVSKWLYSGPGDIFSGTIGDLTGLGNAGFGVGLGGFGIIWTLFFQLPYALLNIFGWPIGIIFRTFILLFSQYALMPTVDTMLKFVNEGTNIPIGLKPLGLGIDLPAIALSGEFAKAAIRTSIIAFLALNIIPQLLIGLAIFLTTLSLMIKILLKLLLSYITILFLIIFAPLVLMFEVLPGNKNFSAWIKSLISELSTYPITIGIFFMGYIIAFAPLAQGGNDSTFHGAETIRFPFLNLGVTAQVRHTFPFIVGMGILFMTPALIDYLKKLITPKGLELPKVNPLMFFGGAIAGYGMATGPAARMVNFLSDPRHRQYDEQGIYIPNAAKTAAGRMGEIAENIPFFGKVISVQRENEEKMRKRQKTTGV